MLGQVGFARERGALSIQQSASDRARGGCVEVWSEDVCPAGRVSWESAIPLHVQAEPGLGADRWYALYVRSRHEKTVENSLRGKGYTAFCPSYRTRRKRVD